MIDDKIIDSFAICDYKVHLLQNSKTTPKENHLYQNKNQDSSKEIGKVYENSKFRIFVRGVSQNNNGTEICLRLDKEKIKRTDKVAVCIKAIIYEQITKNKVFNVKIVYGNTQKSTRIKTSTYNKEATDKLRELDNLTNTEPFYKKECTACEFLDKCLKKLIAKDDLSLLSGMTKNKILRLNRKGIFTIFQFSHTFKLRKKRKDALKDEPVYYPALKALSIRENKVYINGIPKIGELKANAFIDFEGLPDENFTYLIGVCHYKENGIFYEYFWADNKEEEAQIFISLLNYIQKYNFQVLFHYGKFERKKLENFAKENPDYKDKINKVINKLKDIYPIVKNHVYLPIYRNSLKSVGKYLNITREGISNGLESILKRKQWEQKKSPNIKKSLIVYNENDCQSLRIITEWLSKVEKRIKNNDENFIDANDLRTTSNYAYRFGNIDFVNENFKIINKAAYFDYQRNKVYFRENKKIRKGLKREAKFKQKLNKPNKIIKKEIEKCPKCDSKLITRKSTKTKSTIDLKIGRYGVKKWITKWVGGSFYCSNCSKAFVPFKIKDKPYWGETIKIWTVNEYISFRISFQQLQQKLRETYKIKASITELSTFKGIIAEKYKGVFKELEKQLISGKIIHADETKALARGEKSGYVWIFTSLDTVIYIYRENREAGFLKDYLNGFNGVLISDYYSGYDSLKCFQQKCLAHLVRDINDDIRGNPLDKEFIKIANEFGKIMRAIVQTIDKYGLRKWNLSKHKKSVNSFFKKLENENYKSDLSNAYKKRFLKNRGKLFTFLDFNGVPWNNNNAENGIKAFAKYRNLRANQYNKVGLKDYLILLSLHQTCKFRGIEFIEFLKTGKIEG